MNASNWYKALLTIRKGGKQLCPSCNNGHIDVSYNEISNGEGIVIMKCEKCGETVHFSHQLPID